MGRLPRLAPRRAASPSRSAPSAVLICCGRSLLRFPPPDRGLLEGRDQPCLCPQPQLLGGRLWGPGVGIEAAAQRREGGLEPTGADGTGCRTVFLWATCPSLSLGMVVNRGIPPAAKCDRMVASRFLKSFNGSPVPVDLVLNSGFKSDLNHPGILKNKNAHVSCQADQIGI